MGCHGRDTDHLVHEGLDFVLKPLKVATAVGIMMNDPVGNLRYCYTPLVAYITDTPEQTLLLCTSPKASSVSTATYKEFSDSYPHPPRTATQTLDDIKQACTEAEPDNLEHFLKIVKRFLLNGIHKPFWRNWTLSNVLQARGPASFSSLFLGPRLTMVHCCSRTRRN